MYEWSWDVPQEDRLNPAINYGSMTDTRDGQIYKTVTIGSQTWMAVNLNYADSVKTPSLKNNESNCLKSCDALGRLYSWQAAIDYVSLANDPINPQDCGMDKICEMPTKVQGICPEGWRLPSKDDWEILISNAGGQDSASYTLKANNGWGIYSGSDAFGFAVLPNISVLGLFGGGAYFWTSNEYSKISAEVVKFGIYSDVRISSETKYLAYSVRCIKDE